MEVESAKLETIFVTVLYGFLAVVTIGGNLLVVLAFFENKHIRQKLSNYFIVSLAFADLFCGVLIFAVKFGKEVWGLFQPPGAGTWPLGEIECIIWITSGTCLVYFSLCTVVVISYDRFLLVKDAIKYTVTTTRGRVLKMIFATWVVAFTYSILTTMVKYFVFRKSEDDSIPALFTESSYTFTNDSLVSGQSENGVLFSPSVCTEDVYASVSYYPAFIAVDFLVFFCVLAVTNSCVCLKLQQRSRKGIFQPTDGSIKYRVPQDNINAIDTAENYNVTSTQSEGKEETDRSDVIQIPEVSAIKSEKKNEIHVKKTAQIEDIDKQKMYPKQLLQFQKSRKAVMSLTVLVAAYEMCWCPYYVIAILYHSGLVEFSEAVIDVSLDLVWVNSTINPFLYAMTNVRFKKGMTSVLRRYFCWRK